MINFLLILLFAVIVVYIISSASVVNKINDMMLFKQLTLRQSIFKLSLFGKIMLVIGFPITLTFGLAIYVINLIFYFKLFK